MSDTVERAVSLSAVLAIVTRQQDEYGPASGFRMVLNEVAERIRALPTAPAAEARARQPQPAPEAEAGEVAALLREADYVETADPDYRVRHCLVVKLAAALRAIEAARAKLETELYSAALDRAGMRAALTEALGGGVAVEPERRPCPVDGLDEIARAVYAACVAVNEPRLRFASEDEMRGIVTNAIKTAKAEQAERARRGGGR